MSSALNTTGSAVHATPATATWAPIASVVISLLSMAIATGLKVYQVWFVKMQVKLLKQITEATPGVAARQ